MCYKKATATIFASEAAGYVHGDGLGSPTGAVATLPALTYDRGFDLPRQGRILMRPDLLLFGVTSSFELDLEIETRSVVTAGNILRVTRPARTTVALPLLGRKSSLAWPSVLRLDGVVEVCDDGSLHARTLECVSRASDTREPPSDFEGAQGDGDAAPSRRRHDDRSLHCRASFRRLITASSTSAKTTTDKSPTCSWTSIPSH